MRGRQATPEAASADFCVDAVLDAGLRGVDGEPTTLRRHLRPGRPLVIVFVRHFG